jgi:hypothetical protein
MRGALILLLCLVPTLARAQAWTRDAGAGYVNVTVSGLSGTRLYNPDFTTSELATRYSQLTVGLYGEVGIIDRWLTLTLSSELLRRNALSEQGATFGLGDAKLGLYSGLVTGPFRLTVGVDVGLPLGDNSPSAGPNADPEAEQIARSLPTGDGELDFEPRVLFGHGFGGGAWPLQHYVVASVGYAVRTSATVQGVRQPFADAFTYQLELGTKLPIFPLDRIWITAKFFGVESFADNEDAAMGAVGLGNGVTFTSLGLGLNAEIYGGLGVLVQVDTAVRARSIIAAIPIRGGLSYNF